MTVLKKLIAAFVVAAACFGAAAGTVEQATILAEPQMQVEKGRVEGCGYRLKSIPQDFTGLKSVLILDSSFNLYATGFALLKGGALQVDIVNGGPGKSQTKPIQGFWLKAASGNPTTPKGDKATPAETPGYLLYIANSVDVMSLFDALWSGDPVTIGVRLRGEGVDRIYTGRVPLSNADSEEGRRCMDELMKQFRTRLDAESKRLKE